MKSFTLAILLLIAAVGTRAQEGKCKDGALITVSGTAEVLVPPDEVVFHLEIEFVDRNVLVAKRKADDLIRKVVDVAKKNNLDSSAVATSYIGVAPKWRDVEVESEGRSRQKRRDFLGYEVSQSITVTSSDLARFEQLYSDLLDIGVKKISDVGFRNKGIAEYRSQARLMAMRAARDKATAMAKAIGQEIGPACSIEEQNQAGYSLNLSANTANTFQTSDADTDSGSGVQPRLERITASVRVSFRLN